MKSSMTIRNRYSTLSAWMLVLAILFVTCLVLARADPDRDRDELTLPRDDVNTELELALAEEDTETPFEEDFEFDIDYFEDTDKEDDVIPIHPSLLNEMMSRDRSELDTEDNLESEERTRCENLRDVLINKGNFTELIHKRFALSYKTSPHIPFSGTYRRAFGVKRFVHKLAHSTEIEKSELRVMAVDPVVGLCVLESTLDLRSRRTNHTETDVKHVLVFKSWGNKYAGARIYDFNPEVFMKMVKLYTTAAERHAWRLASAIYSKGYKSKRVRRHLYSGTEITLNTVGYSRHGQQVFRGKSALRKAADWVVEHLWKPHMGPGPRPHPKPKYDLVEYEEDEIYDYRDEYSPREEELSPRRSSRYETMYLPDEDDLEEYAGYMEYADSSPRRSGDSRYGDDEDVDEEDEYGSEVGWDRRRRRRRHHHHHHRPNLRKLLKHVFPLALPFTPHWCDIHRSNDTHVSGSCFLPPITRRHRHMLPPFIIGEIYLNAPQIRFTMSFTSCGMLHHLEYTPLQPTPIHGYWKHDKKKKDDDEDKKAEGDAVAVESVDSSSASTSEPEDKPIEERPPREDEEAEEQPSDGGSEDESSR